MKNINPRRIPDDISKVYYETHYGYIYAKAELYLKIGKDRYRKGDAMGFPKTEWEQEFGSEIYDILEKGCKQILNIRCQNPPKVLAFPVSTCYCRCFISNCSGNPSYPIQRSVSLI